MEKNETQNTVILSSLKGCLIERSGVQTQSRGKNGRATGTRRLPEEKRAPCGKAEICVDPNVRF